jgi:hypothetical protein
MLYVPRATAAEDAGVVARLLHGLERADILFDVHERPLLARGKSVDVLRPSVVRQHAAQRQVREAIHQRRQREGAVAGRNATPPADRHVDDDIGNNSGRFGRFRQIARVPLVVDRLNEAVRLLPELHGAPDLVRRQVAGGHTDPVDAGSDQGLSLDQRRRTHTDGPRGQLVLGDGGALVRLGVGSALESVALEGRLHFRDVGLERVQIHAKGRRVEVPLRDARADRRDRARQLVDAVALHGLGDPDVCGDGRGGGQKRPARRQRMLGHSACPLGS